MGAGGLRFIKPGGGEVTNLDFNGNRNITRAIPSLQGANVGGKDVVEFLENAFFPAVAPGLGISTTLKNLDPNFNNTTREIGNIDLGVNVNWSVTHQTFGITAITVAGEAQVVGPAIDEDNDPAGASQGGTVVTKTIGQDGAGTQSFDMSVTDTNGTVKSAGSNSINWYLRRHYGALSQTPGELKALLATTSPAAIAGLVGIAASARALNNNYDCTGGKFIYYLYPLAGGTNVPAGKGFAQIASGSVGSVKNGVDDFSAFTTEVVTYIDRFGVTRQGVLLYTEYQTGSPVNINVIN